METLILTLAKKASDAGTADDALKYSQASLNLANVRARLNEPVPEK